MSRALLKTSTLGPGATVDGAPEPTPRSAGELLLFVVSIGALSGLAEAGLAVWRQRVRHFPTGEYVAGEVFWMTPLAAMTTMAGLALALILAGLLARRPAAFLRIGPLLFVAMAGFSWLRALRVGLSNVAAALLALGLAAVLTRVLASRPRLLRTVARTTAPALGAALIAWAVAVPVARNAAAAKQIAGLPQPARDAPNVLVIIWDCARALSLSLYGYDRETTPRLEAFARRGTVFDRAFATAPWSLPSHASMFTGRYPMELTAARQAPLDDTYPTIGEVLGSKGYGTAGITANIYYGSRAFGIDRGFAWYDDRPPINTRVIVSTWALSRFVLWQVRDRATENAPSAMRPRASHVRESLLSWIDRVEDRPFFAVLNQFDAHDPYFPPAPFRTAFSDEPPRFWLDEEHVAYSDEDLQQLRDAYDGALRYLDHELGLLLDALEQRGILDRTLVIVTSDHGEEFGEHGADLVKHARSLYSPALHVPLVMVYPPGVPAGVRRGEAVSIRDIPATIMDVVAGGEDHPFPGVSLLRYAHGAITPEEAAEPRLSVAESSPMGGVLPTWPIAAGHMFSLVSGDLHYIADGAGREQLFDLSQDPWEQHDFAQTAGAAPHLLRFRAALDTLLRVPPAQRRAFLPRGGAPNGTPE